MGEGIKSDNIWPREPSMPLFESSVFRGHEIEQGFPRENASFPVG